MRRSKPGKSASSTVWRRLPEIPPDPEPSEQELERYLAEANTKAAGFRPETIRLIAAFQWRKTRTDEDPNAFRSWWPPPNYEEYLASPVWQEIRARKLRANCGCAICGLVLATQVHHRDYRPRVLEGKDDNALLALCEVCHWRIEFRPDERKRDPDEVEGAIHILLERYYAPPPPRLRGSGRIAHQGAQRARAVEERRRALSLLQASKTRRDDLANPERPQNTVGSRTRRP